MSLDGAGSDAAASERPILSVGADVDVAGLVDEIRAEVARKMRAGLYPPELMAQMEVAADPLESALEDLRRGAHLSFEPRLYSARRLVGRPAALVKRGIRISLRWYTRWLVEQILSFSGAAVALGTIIVDHLHKQESAIEHLRTEMARERARTRIQLTRLARRLEEAPEGVQTDGQPVPAGNRVVEDAEQRTRQFERAVDYVEFEDRFRLSEEEIGRRQSVYLDLFRRVPGAVVDLGCGRGEFLSLLKTAGIDSYGVDMNSDMVALCRERQLDVRHEHIIAHLDTLAPGTLGGIFSAQVIEHLDPTGVVRLFQLAASALREGGVLVVETLNPQSLATFTSALYVDLGHLRPLHPQLLTFLAESAGFGDVQVRYSSPMPEEARLKLLPSVDDAVMGPLVAQMNENLRRVDDVLFGPVDFAVIARR